MRLQVYGFIHEHQQENYLVILKKTRDGPNTVADKKNISLKATIFSNFMEQEVSLKVISAKHVN